MVYTLVGIAVYVSFYLGSAALNSRLNLRSRPVRVSFMAGLLVFPLLVLMGGTYAIVGLAIAGAILGIFGMVTTEYNQNNGPN